MDLNFAHKLKFYFSLIYYKFKAPFECKNYKLLIIKHELAYLAAHFIRSFKMIQENKIILIKTNSGNFYIRKAWPDLAIASPSFERLDLDRMYKLINVSLEKGQKVLFVDIGAGFGRYTVSIANRTKKYQHLQIWAFEPLKENFYLLQKNVKRNKLSNVKILNIALSNNKKEKTFFVNERMIMLTSFNSGPKKIGVKTNKLDNYFKNLYGYDEIFIKIDVEGHETEVLKGASRIFAMHKKIHLLIEDSIDKRIKNYLSKKFKLISKQTTYNSFWEK